MTKYKYLFCFQRNVTSHVGPGRAIRVMAHHDSDQNRLTGVTGGTGEECTLTQSQQKIGPRKLLLMFMNPISAFQGIQTNHDPSMSNMI